MLTFLEWVSAGNRTTCTTQGQVQELWRIVREGDEGYQAFIDQTNRQFRTWITTLLRMGKFSDARNEAEARQIVAEPHYFNYAQELLAAAGSGSGRARLEGPGHPRRRPRGQRATLDEAAEPCNLRARGRHLGEPESVLAGRSKRNSGNDKKLGSQCRRPLLLWSPSAAGPP